LSRALCTTLMCGMYYVSIQVRGSLKQGMSKTGNARSEATNARVNGWPSRGIKDRVQTNHAARPI
jgi:hypothetical protein